MLYVVKDETVKSQINQAYPASDEMPVFRGSPA